MLGLISCEPVAVPVLLSGPRAIAEAVLGTSPAPSRMAAPVRAVVDAAYRGSATDCGAASRVLGISPFQLKGRLRRAGLPPTSTLIAVARLGRLAELILLDGLTLSRAAYGSGYPDGFAASRHMHRVLGLRPSHLKRTDPALLDAAFARAIRTPRPTPTLGA